MLLLDMENTVVPKEAEKLLANQSVDIAAQVAAMRLKRAGMNVKEMGLKEKSPPQATKISPSLRKRLAGV